MRALAVIACGALMGCSLLFSPSDPVDAAPDGGSPGDDAALADAGIALPTCNRVADLADDFSAVTRFWVPAGGSITANGALALEAFESQSATYTSLHRYNMYGSELVLHTATLSAGATTWLRLIVDGDEFGDAATIAYSVRIGSGMLTLERSNAGTRTDFDSQELDDVSVVRLVHQPATGTLEMAAGPSPDDFLSAAAIAVDPADNLELVRVQLRVDGGGEMGVTYTSSFDALNRQSDQQVCPFADFADQFEGPPMSRQWLSAGCAATFDDDGVRLAPASSGCSVFSSAAFDLRGGAVTAHMRPQSDDLAWLQVELEDNTDYFRLTVDTTGGMTRLTARRQHVPDDTIDTVSPDIPGVASDVWMRIAGNSSGDADISYSLNGVTYTLLESHAAPDLAGVRVRLESNGGDMRFRSVVGE